MYWLSNFRGNGRCWATCKWYSSQHMRPVSLLDSKPFKNLGQTNSFRFSDSPIPRAGRPITHQSRLICFSKHWRPGGTALRFTVKTQAAARWPFQTSIMMQSEPLRPCQWTPVVVNIWPCSAAKQQETAQHTAPRQASRTSGRPQRDSFKHKTSPCPGHNKCRCRWLPRASLCGFLRSGSHLKLCLPVFLPVFLPANSSCFPTKLLFSRSRCSGPLNILTLHDLDLHSPTLPQLWLVAFVP